MFLKNCDFFTWHRRSLAPLLGLAAWALVGCGNNGLSVAEAPAQRWNGVDVRIESRPNPSVVGMNEFLAIVTETQGQPAWNCLVAFRTANSDPWKQAIQDGHVAVYRRAALVGFGERSVLQVQIKCGDDETVLHFPLTVVKP